MEWVLKKANDDTERFHLNKILADIQTTIDVVVAGGGTVTAVAVADAVGITWVGSPIIGAGTLIPTLSTNLQAWSGLAPSSKENAFTKGNLIQGTNVTLTGTLTGRLVGAGDVTVSASGGGISVQSVVSAATVTPANGDDEVVITAQAVALALANWSGAPAQGWGIVIRIKDNGTARAITYGTNYRAAADVTLPTTTVVGKTHYLCCIHNSTDTKHDVIAYGVMP